MYIFVAQYHATLRIYKCCIQTFVYSRSPNACVQANVCNLTLYIKFSQNLLTLSLPPSCTLLPPPIFPQGYLELDLDDIMVIDESERESKVKVRKLQKKCNTCTWLKLWVLRPNDSSTLTLIKCMVCYSQFLFVQEYLKDANRPCEVIMTQYMS